MFHRHRHRPSITWNSSYTESNHRWRFQLHSQGRLTSALNQRQPRHYFPLDAGKRPPIQSLTDGRTPPKASKVRHAKACWAVKAAFSRAKSGPSASSKVASVQRGAQDGLLMARCHSVLPNAQQPAFHVLLLLARQHFSSLFSFSSPSSNCYSTGFIAHLEQASSPRNYLHASISYNEGLHRVSRLYRGSCCCPGSQRPPNLRCK